MNLNKLNIIYVPTVWFSALNRRGEDGRRLYNFVYKNEFYFLVLKSILIHDLIPCIYYQHCCLLALIPPSEVRTA